jgi:uroporphyrin-III C-methyltransferase
MTTVGTVTLVGAGPGDPDLLTVRALRALERADVVLYDALVDPRLLALCPRAQRFSVGKRRGAHSMAQETISALLVRAARRGKRVVRLKCGDPFVLGRGGEEALALEAAGVPVEVVPGVTSAVAGPASAGIPVTHRGLASGFLVLSAVPEEACIRVLSTLPPDAVTVVLLMATSGRASIVARLLGAGWPGSHPAALVLGAHGPRAWTRTCTLAELGAVRIPEDRADLPGMVVLGRTVAIATSIRRALRGPGLAREATEPRPALAANARTGATP